MPLWSYLANALPYLLTTGCLKMQISVFCYEMTTDLKGSEKRRTLYIIWHLLTVQDLKICILMMRPKYNTTLE